jgi:hypothetical protein
METTMGITAASGMRTARWTNGFWLLSIGVIHNLLGIAVGLGVPAALPEVLRGRRLFAEIVSAGVIGGVEPDTWRMLLFWFLFFGFAIMILGWLIHSFERAGHRIPRAVAWQIGVLALAGGLLIPASGFWLVLPVAWRLGRSRAPVTA